MFAKGGCLVCQNHALPGLLPVFIHGFVVFLVFARGDVVHPFLVVEVPAHGLFDAFFELQRGFPAQLVFQFARIDGIPQVVPRTVGDVGDELLALAFGVAQQPIDGADDDFNQVDVLPFVESADIVGFGDAAFVEDQVDGAGVVFDVEPVADILALAIDRQRPAWRMLLMNSGISFSGN